MATHSQVDGGFIERFIYHFIENVVAQVRSFSFHMLTTRRSSVTQPPISAPDPLGLLMCHWFCIGVELSLVPFIASGCLQSPGW